MVPFTNCLKTRFIFYSLMHRHEIRSRAHEIVSRAHEIYLYSDTTQLNSTSSWVELSCVAINTPLVNAITLKLFQISSQNFHGSKIWLKARMSSKTALFRYTAAHGWFDVLVQTENQLRFSRGNQNRRYCTVTEWMVFWHEKKWRHLALAIQSSIGHFTSGDINSKYNIIRHKKT